jgi:hypothetical protein
MEMRFHTANKKKVVLWGMSNGGPNIVSTKRMEALFRHRYVVCAVECLITAQEHAEGRNHQHVNIQLLLSKHERVFGQIPLGRPPDKGFEHSIELEKGAKTVIITPYRHPKKFKDEIEKAIKELHDMGHIRPSSSPFTSSIVLVKKKDKTMRMCIDCKAMNKNMIKKKYPIPKNDGILYELHGAVYFSNIDLRSGYHQIRVREQDIPKTTFRCHYGNYVFLAMPFGLTQRTSYV